MDNSANLPPVLQSWTYFLSQDPAVRMLQSGMLVMGLLLVFLVFYATKDILQRTHSLVYMFVCIALVAFLPVLGFLIYLLIRPSQTLKEREMEDMLRSLVHTQQPPPMVTNTKPVSAPKKTVESAS